MSMHAPSVSDAARIPATVNPAPANLLVVVFMYSSEPKVHGEPEAARGRIGPELAHRCIHATAFDAFRVVSQPAGEGEQVAAAGGEPDEARPAPEPGDQGLGQVER